MKHLLPYLFVLALFALMACQEMLTEGMFMDGLIYTGVAKSMSLGIGSFWSPSYTLTSFVHFYEHPPLMMWLLSLWMRLFGSTMMVAKAYSIVVTMLTAVLMVAVWKRSGGSLKTGWLPLLLWTLIPPVAHFANNNILESTMVLFDLAAVWLMLADGRRPWLSHVAAGLMLSCAFLTKGFTGLFPLALPALLWMVGARKGRRLGDAVVLTLMVTAVAAAPLLTAYAAVPEAAAFLDQYLNIQLVNGVHVHVVDSRWYIVGRFFIHTVIVWGLLLLALLLGLRSGKSQLRPGAVLGGNRTAWALLLLALCGVLPMMVSFKQRDFYLFTAYPFLALALACWIEPYVSNCCQWMERKAFGGVTVVMLLAAVIVNGYFCGKPGRSHNKLTDRDVIAPCLAVGETVTIPTELRYDYELQGYYYINRQVSLDAVNVHRHLLTTAEYPADSTYREISLPTEQYHLYELQAE